jgi:hypothetical protein
MNTKIEEVTGNRGTNDVEELSLKKLILWTMEPIERMKWLAIACESVYRNINN